MSKMIRPTVGTTRPPSRVREAEDNNIEQGLIPLAGLSLSDSRLHHRPDYGTNNMKADYQLRTNYFEITINTKKTITRYEIKITPAAKDARAGDGKKSARQTEQSKSEISEGKSKEKTEDFSPVKDASLGARKRRSLLTCLLRDPDFVSARSKACVATDYASILLSSTPLNLGSTDSRTFRIVWTENGGPTQPSANNTYDISITKAGMVPTNALLRYLASTSCSTSDVAEKAEAIHALNIILARAPNENANVIKSGRNRYYLKPPKDMLLQGGLVAFRGYFSSVRTSTARVLLNVNVQCSPFYPEGRLDHLIGKLSSTYRSGLDQFLRGLRVELRCIKDAAGNRLTRVKNICGVSGRGAQQINFGTEYGTNMSVQDYFSTRM